MCVLSGKPEESEFGSATQRLCEVFSNLALRRESNIEEGHLMADHVDMLISISSKWPG
jgi:putative transposase